MNMDASMSTNMNSSIHANDNKKKNVIRFMYNIFYSLT